MVPLAFVSDGAGAMDARSLTLTKYPRTPHLEGSRLQKGDEDHDQVPYRTLAGRFIVVEEKLDGANTGVSYDADCNQRLQSRGHYLLGGPNDGDFSLFKQWAAAHLDALFDRLGTRYLMFGEWLAHKHTVFYDWLPHFFQEFDLLDTETGVFLDTARRHALLAGSPVQSVPVLYQGPAPRTLPELLRLVRPALAKSPQWEAALLETARRRNLDPERTWAETEHSRLAEGLYIKVEDGGEVVQRLKWVRADFVQALMESDSHWAWRPKVPNGLHPAADLFAPQPTMTWERLAAAQAVAQGMDVLITQARQEVAR
jgi:hypothetical protein